MNILILVGSFLLILSFGAATLVKHGTSSLLKQTYFTSSMNVEKRVHNAAQKKQFLAKASKTKKKENSTETSKSEKKESKPKIFKRDRENPSELSKLNLSPLFVSPAPSTHSEHYEIAAKLLRNIYVGTSIEKAAAAASIADFEYKILDALIELGRSQKETLSFEKLIPEERSLRELYIKMIKGTKHYSVDEKKGYPPLEDFFLLDNGKKSKPILFCFASTPLLRSVFGESVLQTILEQEKEKGEKGVSPPLKKEELEALLVKNGDPKIQLTTLTDLLNFTRRGVPSQTVTYSDPKTKIRRKLPLLKEQNSR
ncbi:MAG: hypothetical protein HYX48_00010 [Chlamydiales bacterium]|nr:hypothetical protein [Chlamydiales bacterium]